MDDQVDAALDAAAHCLVAARGAGGPIVARAAHWWDGAGVWFAAGGERPEVEALRAAPRCLVYLPGADGHDLSGEGLARVYDADDPATLAAHAPTIAAALAALAVKHAADLIGHARALVQDPPTSLPVLPAVVRIPLERAGFEEPVGLEAGVAPALATAVPPGVRRALAGQRRIVLVTQDTREDGPPHVGPAVWGAGLSLAVPRWRELQPGQRAVAVAEGEAGQDRASAALSLEGVIDRDGALRPERAVWWLGLERGEAAIGDRAAHLQLPD